MKITLINRFHNTATSIRVKAEKSGDEFLMSRRQYLRMRKALCPHSGNSCNCNPMTVAARDSFDYREMYEDYDRNILCQVI